ncbi:hypothetical protein GGF37_001218 [Kickxella alabastrina]|nr:hypothetical protein GGF37_001218 [Kickxella alabastrina]
MNDNSVANESSEKLILTINEAEPTNSPTANYAVKQWRQLVISVLVKYAKFMVALLSLMLLVTLYHCTMNQDSDNNGVARDNLEPLAHNQIQDCRVKGCAEGMQCMQAENNIACFVQPCPGIYECMPASGVAKEREKEEEGGVYSILPIMPAEGGDEAAVADVMKLAVGKLTEGFFACVQSHGGKEMWAHPVESCNTCRCTAAGAVACTKMMCKSGNEDFKKMVGKAEEKEKAEVKENKVDGKTLMALVSVDGANSSPIYDSVVFSA